jgi:AraC-like DNA-binding protein
MSKMVENEILLEALTYTNLGRAILAGEIQGGRGVRSKSRWRIYGSYAVVAILQGSGHYRDANGVHAEVCAGDLIFVFPDLPHWYGPRKRERWDEIYLTFDGPIFDLWRKEGLLNIVQPLCHLGENSTVWVNQLQQWIQARHSQESTIARLQALHSLLNLLLEPLLSREQKSAPQAEAWLSRACMRLETELGAPLILLDVAREVGLGYETFRKQFQRAKGVSPARYRMECRIAMAQQLLRFNPERTNQEVADSLGFTDAFHFSRRFTEIAGQTPRTYRVACRGHGEGSEK